MNSLAFAASKKSTDQRCHFLLISVSANEIASFHVDKSESYNLTFNMPMCLKPLFLEKKHFDVCFSPIRFISFEFVFVFYSEYLYPHLCTSVGINT